MSVQKSVVMELNKCTIDDRSQSGQRLTLEETIFSFARDDVGLTDVVVSCFEAPWIQDTATQPWHKKCHKAIIAAKSRSLRVLLKQHEYLDDVGLIFAGAFDASQVDRFFTEIYRGKDGVELWGLDDTLSEPSVKFEVNEDADKGSTVAQGKKHIGPKRKLRESQVEFIDDNNPIQELHPIYEYDSVGRNISASARKRKREEGYGINSFYLARQIKQNAPNVELVSQAVSQVVDGQDRFRSIKVDGAIVNFVYCLDCHCVLSYDKRPGGSRTLAGHDCQSRLKSADSVIGSKVAREVIEGLVFNKDSEISYVPYRESGCSNLLRRILYNERKMPYCFCKICRDIVADDELENHECFTVRSHLESRPACQAECHPKTHNFFCYRNVHA